MSATQDKSQKITFVYSNLYEIYRKGKQAASEAPAAPAEGHVGSGAVLKAGDLREPTLAIPRVKNYEPTEFLAKRMAAAAAKPQILPASLPRTVARPASLPPVRKNEALESLKENLKSLNDLHSRLRFMLQELEELVKD